MWPVYFMTTKLNLCYIPFVFSILTTSLLQTSKVNLYFCLKFYENFLIFPAYNRDYKHPLILCPENWLILSIINWCWSCSQRWWLEYSLQNYLLQDRMACSNYHLCKSFQYQLKINKTVDYLDKRGISSLCTTLHGWIKGKSRDTNLMYPWKERYK